jgi:hypothetical protein
MVPPKIVEETKLRREVI